MDIESLIGIESLFDIESLLWWAQPRPGKPEIWESQAFLLGLCADLPRSSQDQAREQPTHEPEGLCLGICGRVQQDCAQGLGTRVNSIYYHTIVNCFREFSSVYIYQSTWSRLGLLAVCWSLLLNNPENWRVKDDVRRLTYNLLRCPSELLDIIGLMCENTKPEYAGGDVLNSPSDVLSGRILLPFSLLGTCWTCLFFSQPNAVCIVRFVALPDCLIPTDLSQSCPCSYVHREHGRGLLHSWNHPRWSWGCVERGSGQWSPKC